MSSTGSAGSTGVDHRMASVPRRKKNIPAELLESLEKIVELIDKYIQMFGEKEGRMTAIQQGINLISKEIKEKLETAGKVKTGGLIVGGLGIFALGLVAAPFTGGGSLVAAAAVLGGAVAIGALIREFLLKDGRAEKIKNQGNEFRELITPIALKLAEIEKNCKKLVEMLANTEGEDVKKLSEQITLVKSWIAAANKQAGELRESLKKTLDLISKVLEKTLDNQEGQDLSNLVIESGDQCGKIISEFREGKTKLSEFKKDIEKVK